MSEIGKNWKFPALRGTNIIRLWMESNVNNHIETRRIDISIQSTRIKYNTQLWTGKFSSKGLNIDVMREKFTWLLAGEGDPRKNQQKTRHRHPRDHRHLAVVGNSVCTANLSRYKFEFVSEHANLVSLEGKLRIQSFSRVSCRLRHGDSPPPSPLNIFHGYKTRNRVFYLKYRPGNCRLFRLFEMKFHAKKDDRYVMEFIEL